MNVAGAGYVCATSPNVVPLVTADPKATAAAPPARFSALNDRC
jgi:hypothetical protein